jgi:transcriptional regulatory protein LevR
MWKAALAGVVALATVGSLSISNDGVGIGKAAAQNIIITEGHIARLKNVLKLTSAQERHWRPVEASLRALMHSHGQQEASVDAQVVQRVRARIASYTLDAVALQRLAAVAQPLIDSLDEDQKQNGLMVIQSMGIASLQ